MVAVSCSGFTSGSFAGPLMIVICPPAQANESRKHATTFRTIFIFTQLLYSDSALRPVKSLSTLYKQTRGRLPVPVSQSSLITDH
jgi:hypothetical protein